MTEKTSAYLEAARKIGAQLARDAIWHEQRCNWFAPFHESATGGREEGICTLGPTLYDGTAGIALFLGSLALVTGDPVFKAVARAAVEHSLSRLEDVLAPMRQGFYTGAVGVGYVAVRVGQACRDDELVNRGLAVIAETLEPRPTAAMTDVISGLAGIIPALLSLYAEFGDKGLLDAAVHAGEAILERAQESDRGLSWDTMGEMAAAMEAAGMPGLVADPAGKPNLTGLSHGAGGIALALLELGHAVSEPRFERAARRAFVYEDSWFDEARGSWPDLRHPDGKDGTVSAWCHGASGIGLARLRAYEITRAEPFRADVMKCLNTAGRVIGARMADSQGNFSLCHGLAGDAEPFMIAAGLLALPDAGKVAEAVADFGLRMFSDAGAPWPSGAPGRTQAPGLMLGIAGTGYFYLRMSNPDRIPSILSVG
jgi:lantibiotic modifying enzyme